MSAHRGPEAADRLVTRRRFLGGVGAITSVVVAGQVVDVWGPSSAALAATGDSKSLGRTLVVVELAGGNDGLSTVVPLTDGRYRDLRPSLAVANAIDLDGSVGLHPNLTWTASRYRAGQVAIVQGVGYPKPNLSHFVSMQVWWSASPDDLVGTGWLGRYLDGSVGRKDALAAIGIGATPTPALTGVNSFALSIADATGLQPRLPAWADTSDEVIAAWRGLTPAKADTRSLHGQIQDVIRRTSDARRELDRRLGSVESEGTTVTPLNGGQTPTESPQRAAVDTSAFELAAELVASPNPPRVVYIHTLGDYDTHQGQAQRHPALMTELDTDLEAFFAALEARQVADRAVVVTTSEFGRRAAENGAGTDHGAASHALVIGPKVKGGRYGQMPSLTQLDAQGNLAMTVDFRSLFATVLEGWLDADAKEVLGARFEDLKIFA